MKKRFSFISMLCFIVLLFSGCTDKEPANIFEYAVQIEDGKLLPKQIDYLMSVEEVLAAKKLDESAVLNYGVTETHKQIITELELENFPYDLEEIILFQEDKAVCSVEYRIKVSMDDRAGLCKYLEKQAEEYLPEPTGSLNDGIKDGESTWWEDEDGNVVVFSMYQDINGGEDERVRYLSLKLNVSSTTIKKELEISENEIYPDNYEKLSTLFGKTRAEVEKEVSLVPEAVDGRYSTNEMTEFLGTKFDVTLYFNDADRLYIIEYELHDFAYTYARKVKVTEELFQQLRVLYGEPDIYPYSYGRMTRLITPFDDLMVADDAWYLTEEAPESAKTYMSELEQSKEYDVVEYTMKYSVWSYGVPYTKLSYGIYAVGSE